MNTLRVCALAFALIGLSLSPRFPAEVHADALATAADHVLTGELVVTNAARNQFRLVQHSGSFTAPAGTSVEALGGKPVQVEFGRDGRVLQVSQLPIRIEPITHGFEVISGELVARDPVMHTFAIAGDDRTFVAPSRVDIDRYAGRLVQARLDEQGRVIGIDLIARSADAPLPRSPRECILGDATLAIGSSICRRGMTFRCANGEWVSTGAACS